MFQHVVAIVSGGASGLGAATASYLVKKGARVVVADCGALAREQFSKMEAALAHSSDDENGHIGGHLQFMMTDVTSEEEVGWALDVAEEEFGEQGALYLLLVVFDFAQLQCKISQRSICCIQNQSQPSNQLCRHSTSKENTLHQAKFRRLNDPPPPSPL